MCDERLQSARQGHRKNPEAMSGCTPVAALRAKSEAPDRRKVVLLIAMSEVATFRWQPLRCDERSRGGRPVRDWQMGCGAESEERCGSLVGDSTTTCPADLTGDYYSEGSPSRFGKPAAIRLTILSQTDPPADDLRRHSLENRVRPPGVLRPPQWGLRGHFVLNKNKRRARGAARPLGRSTQTIE